MVEQQKPNQFIEIQDQKNTAAQEAEKRIGNYKIEKTLGQGTFGKVKQGIHIHTNQKVIFSSYKPIGCYKNTGEEKNQGCE